MKRKLFWRPVCTLVLTGVFCMQTAAPVIDEITAAAASYQGMLYEITSSQTITITSFDQSQTMVQIPEQIDGLPVTAISAGAFSGNTALTTVVVPSCVTDIGWSAFGYDANGRFYPVTLVGYKNTAVQTYAQENGITFSSLGYAPEWYSPGDITMDGGVMLEDASEVLSVYAQKAAGSYAPGIHIDSQLKAADVNEDSAIDLEDASAILSYYASGAAGLNADWNMILGRDADVPRLTVAAYSDFVQLSWNAVPDAVSYQIYRSESAWDSPVLLTEVSGETSYYTDHVADKENAAYCYQVRTIKQNTVSDFSEQISCADYDSCLNAAKRTPHREIVMYNCQGSATEVASVYAMTDEDIALLQAFEYNQFSDGMSMAEKLYAALLWINRNVTYASGTLWNDIAGMSWVEAVFSEKKGQCIQFNGAMASLLAYYGFDSSMIQGYRGIWGSSYWSHFWCEVAIGGNVYIMEVGNYGEDGNWHYFLTPYCNTTKFIKNQINL